MTTRYPSPTEVLPWIVRDASGRWLGGEFETREEAEHAAGRVPGAVACRDNYAAANAGAHRRFLGVAPVTVTPMRRLGAWGDE